MIEGCDNNYVEDMILVFQKINNMVQNAPDEQHSSSDFLVWQHVNKNLLFNDDEKEFLPIPVFSYIVPTMNTSFLLHIMLSMGRFETEIDIFLHGTLRECLRYCCLIVDKEDTASLKFYAGALTKVFIEDQMQYFPNLKRVIDFWIITTFDLFSSIIVDNVLPVSEMPPVQLYTLLLSNEVEMVTYKGTIKSNCIDAALKGMGSACEYIDGLPSKEELLEASLSFTCGWDPVSSIRKNQIQSRESFVEQLFAIKLCKEAIDNYCNVNEQVHFTKNIGIRGFPGGGKTWCMMYCMLYAISKGLTVCTTAMMCKRALHLGGVHVNQVFKLPF